MLVGLLVSYHATLHDMTLTILPAGVLLAEGITWHRNWKIAVATTLLVSPFVLFLTGGRYYLFALAILAATIVEARVSEATPSKRAYGSATEEALSTP